MTRHPYRAALLAATMGVLSIPAFGQVAAAGGTIEVLPADAANAQDAELKKQIDELAARVTALEKGQKPPVDPPLVESQDLATVSVTDSPTAKLVGKQGHTYSIALGKAVMDGRPVQDTGGVNLLKKVDKPVDTLVPGGVFQRNSVNSWYGPVTATTGGPPLPGDPSVAVTPPVTGDAPAPAKAVGFNTATASGKVVMGTTPANWRLWDGLSDVRTNADGTVTVSTGRSNGYNAHIVTATPSAGAFLGKTFKGSCGGYYAMQFSFPGQATMNNGWPSFWANDMENQSAQGGGLAHWPNQPAGYVTSIEVDVVEFMSGNNSSYGGALHHWYGNSPYPATNTDGSGSPFPVPGGTNMAQPHWYGGLHVPATATSKGYFEWYFDHKKVGNRITWDRYNPNAAPPPVNGSSAYAVMDERNLYWIAGSGPTNPITISAFEAWQPRADCTTSR